MNGSFNAFNAFNVSRCDMNQDSIWIYKLTIYPFLFLN